MGVGVDGGATGFVFGAPGFVFGRRVGSASEQLNAAKAPHEKQVWHALPPPSGEPPFRLELAAVLGEAAVAAIAKAGRLDFHTVGDTGGIDNPYPQLIVAQWLEHDAAQHAAAFLYHLGDVVYYDGEHGSYYQQFYEPYLHYPAPIFGIPGNHDTDVGVPPNHTALEPFVANFCAAAPGHLPDAREVERTTMIQPNCYWTLNTPMATIVGLATNAPEHGEVGHDQADWLEGELRDAPRERALLVALHHPPLSADDHHGASLAMRDLLDTAFTRAGRVPDLVLSGHVHNYQRFQRKLKGRPDAHLHRGRRWRLPEPARPGKGRRRAATAPLDRPVRGFTLASYSKEHRHGFLRLSITKAQIRGVYNTVPRPQESWSDGPVATIDQFQIRIKRQ